MKSYIVYDGTGVERMTIRAPSHNLAEIIAKKMFGNNASVCYTEPKMADWPDSFGLPAEQYAVKTGQHPRVTGEYPYPWRCSNPPP